MDRLTPGGERDAVGHPTVVGRPAGRPTGLVIGLVVGSLLLLLVLLTLFGELGAFLGHAFEVMPFVALALLAGLGEQYRWGRWLAVIYLFLLSWALLIFSGLLVFAGAVGASGLRGLTEGAAETAPLLPGLMALGQFLLLGVLLLGVSWLVVLPGLRRRLERWLPLRPGSFINGIGLSTTLLLILLPLATLAILGGRPPLLTLISAGTTGELTVRPIDQIYPFIWLLPASLVLVGYPLSRGFGSALERLGLVRPTWRQIGFGLVVALVMVALAIGVDQVIAWLWGSLGWPRTDTRAFERLIQGLISPLGAVIIGVTAGLGEEIAFRGVLQPRVGLLLANLAFTAVHAYQYGFDGLLSVFLVGLLLGWLRQRTNTSTAAIAHGGYDFVLVLAAALGFG